MQGLSKFTEWLFDNEKHCASAQAFFGCLKFGSPSCPILGAKLAVLPLWALYKHLTTNFKFFYFLFTSSVEKKKFFYCDFVAVLWSLYFLFSWASHTLACFPAPLRQFYQQNPCPQETKQDLRQRVEDEYRRWKCKLPSSLHYRLCIWKIDLAFVVVCYSSNSSFGLLH